jgi:two-component sensor histidine kinase
MTEREISLDSDPMRVFVLAPAGRDATVTAGVLSEGGFSARICTSTRALCARIKQGAGAAVITEEALGPAALDQLVRCLSKQPPWSDFPLILLIGGRGVATAISRILEAVGTEGSVTLLERPMLREALLSAVRVALRSRCRQYEIRDHLERQSLLVAELSHRVKNTLATVLSIAGLTLARAESLDEFSRSFRGRIQALAAAHDLLTAVNWDVAGLRVLVEQALRPYASGDGSNVQISGDEVLLRPSAALTFSLILHELTTNAAKHGALQRPEGVVAVDYRVRSKGGRELHLHWAETGGPPVRPPVRRGFGLDLIERSVAYELGGQAVLDYRVEGLSCDITVRLTDSVGTSVSGAHRSASSRRRPGLDRQKARQSPS